jgi:8-oxo-dGTP diphosphatase
VFDVAVTYIMRHHEGAPQVLLGEKLTGLGVGKIVGPGGKSEAGESPISTAIREIHEEVGLVVKPSDLQAIALITYPFVHRPHLSQRSHVFMTEVFSGTVVSSEELRATWWPVAEIPYDRMWPDAARWLPSALQGTFVEQTFVIGEDDTVVG